MKKILSILSLCYILFSCDNGDITVTNFEGLQESNLRMCSIGGKRVLYAFNSNQVFESMSLELSDNRFMDSLSGVLRREPGEIELELNDNNRLVYRVYDGEISQNYFCQPVPPRQPQVIDEYISRGGRVFVITRYNDEGPNGDADGDGVSNADEGMDLEGNNHLDTDGDGIPDYLDPDDDNDNVPTRQEAVNDPETGEYILSANGIPRYLDPDDDNDGTPTRYEVDPNEPETWLNPATYIVLEDGTPNYLTPELWERYEPSPEVYADHNITRQLVTSIVIRNFSFVRTDGSEELKFDEFVLGNFTNTTGIIQRQTPFENSPGNSNPDEEDEDESERGN
ncbi:hypothetical protein ACW6QP_08920 [Salegentibacter sp. HM20]